MFECPVDKRPFEVRILDCLKRYPGWMTTKLIALRCNPGDPRATAQKLRPILDDMEKRGLIEEDAPYIGAGSKWRLKAPRAKAARLD